MVMLDYTVDILLIGFIVVLVVQLLKAPIKAILVRKGLGESEKMSKIFNAVMTLFSYTACFIGACAYFYYFKHYPLFKDTKILSYTIGVIGSSQAIYKVLETYGRDGLFAIFEAIIEKIKAGKAADGKALPTVDTAVLAAQVYAGIKERFEGASITEDDVRQILEEKFVSHT